MLSNVLIRAVGIFTAPIYTRLMTTAETGYAHTYVVKQNGVQVGEKINIPKDFLVKSGEVKTVTTADTPVTGYVVGQKYLDFVVNTVGGDGTDSHIYILVEDLVDVYTAGNGIDISNSNVVSVKIDSNSVNGLSTSANGLALANASSVSGGAMSSTDKVKLDGIDTGANLYIHPSLSDGALTGVETDNVTPGFGAAVSISQVVTDGYGHTTALNTRTVTIPNATAVANTMSGDTIVSAGSAGLMSAADKTNLDALVAGGNETVTAEEIAAIFVDSE